jgi:LysM repeat protein
VAGRVHTVERGDTLFSIARRNGTTVEALVDANGLGSRDAVLSVGRRLVLP